MLEFLFGMIVVPIILILVLNAADGGGGQNRPLGRVKYHTKYRDPRNSPPD